MGDMDLIEELEKLDEDYLFEMAQVSKDDTGLPYDLWIDGMGKDRNNTHNTPRIKVRVKDKLIPMTIDKDNPDIPESVKKMGTTTFKGISKIRKYIKEYYSVFMKHWNREITDKQALNMLGQTEADDNQIKLF